MDALGPYGFSVDVGAAGAPAEIERSGYRTLWVNGGRLDRLDRLLDVIESTEHAVVAPAIIPPDVYDPAAVTDLFRRAELAAPGRLLVGLGSPQRPRPLAAVRGYVDELDAATAPIPQRRRLLAAFGPKALDLARDRFAGAIGGLFTPAYTAAARQRLGADRTLVVGLYVVLDDDPAAARAAAREPLSFLATLPPYINSFRRQGFTDEDVATLSDALIDELVAWGEPDRVAAHARELRAAGADHVQLTVLGGPGRPSGPEAARLLATALSSPSTPAAPRPTTS
ncbi:TIGR03620 family F420-dependent LLM class oxidoreductase [Mycolicibacterium arseniciresistens]|uniref:TIGR03620 family F420-dependent LLM class oxidoreductase n=1 Tax=Mycolicibacterium arseniciresistens TaxID=3062257 RepID=A0ABT8UG59_9MYCO|nr:TIGR03620 family F420-dependent LLM class oxidoreductase [Mycolicibacterium arseniciresistens]MDO3635860.1 TIGR03620 family F420-dependent LLM class oxidoreductase [Mycolicibacterium arseniciresistens]